MRRTTLGRSGIDVCVAPLGAMFLGTKQRGDDAFALLDAYVGAGGDFIDTANIYAHWVGQGWQGGESETLLGEWMATRRNRGALIVATKVGFNYRDVPVSLSPRLIRQECDKSLRRLRTDVIDLYFAHTDDPAVPQAEVLETFATLIGEGKVRAIGASNFTTHRLAVANEIARTAGLPRYEVLQQRHTYLRLRRDGDTGRQVVLTDDMENFCRSEGLSIMAYSATLGGAYSGRGDRPLPEAYRSLANAERNKVLGVVAAEIGATPLQVVLAWMWSKPHMLPLIAASTAGQLALNLAAGRMTLDPGQVARLNSAGDDPA